MRPLLRRLIVLLLASAVLDPVGSAWAAPVQKRVLALYSTRRDAQIVVVGERELPLALDNGLTDGLDYYSEFIDQARFSQPDYEAAFRDFLRSKYKDRPFDLVIAMSDIALDFVTRNREVLFTGTPVVFFASRPVAERPANATGITADLNLGGTLTLAAALQPDVQRVFVVSGAGEVNAAYERAARPQFQRFEPRFAFTYLSGLPTTELDARLSSLPPHSIVYYLVVDRDGAQQNFHPIEYLERVTGVANAPVYCWVDSAMDHGIVGGSLKDQVRQTRAVADLALRVLHGERADSIPVATVDLNVAQVDWRQLRRWGISEARVPAGTRVLFREPSAWDRYRPYIVGGAALLLAQTALIAGLLLQRARRRSAENEMRRSQVELRKSYQRIRDLGARLLKAQEAERSRLASELHDDISQQMTLLEIDLRLLGGSVRGDAERLADEALHRAQHVTRSMRDLSHRLHPAGLRLIGLVAALDGLRQELAQSDGRFEITFTHENVPATLPPDLTVAFFRIVQEALQNALKYSRGHHVAVHLEGRSNEIALTIEDDGVGFDVTAAAGRGLGMITMGERLEAIGGTFRVDSKPGAGTRLQATAPLRAPAAPMDQGRPIAV